MKIDARAWLALLALIGIWLEPIGLLVWIWAGDWRLVPSGIVLAIVGLFGVGVVETWRKQKGKANG